MSLDLRSLDLRSAGRPTGQSRTVESAPERRPWLDWQRGLAVLLMIEVHVLDAWRAPGTGGSLTDVLRFLGGLAAPGFLYLAGLSLVLADAAGARRGVDPERRRAALAWRAGRLLAVALGLRCLEVVAAAAARGSVPWSELVRVDILHVIALSLLAGAWIAVGRGALGCVAAGLTAAGVVAVTPLLLSWLATLDLPGATSPGPAGPLARAADLALAVLGGVPPRATFSLLNWSAFLLAGAALGPLALRRARPFAWLLLGAALVALGGLGAAQAAAASWWGRDFWRTSPAWFTARLGLCALLTGAVQLAPPSAAQPLRPLALLGRHSLLAYVLSVELTYGGITDPLRGRLGVPGVLAGIAGVTLVTWLAVAAWARWRGRPGAAG